MISVQDNIPTVLAHLTVKESALKNLKPDLDKLSIDYVPVAREIVLQTVYSAPANPDYPRTYNLLNSTDADRPDEDTIRIFLNPSQAMAATRFPGLRSYYNLVGKVGYRFYPSYVREGNFFGVRQAERDFVQGWINEFSNRFPADVKRIVSKAVERG